MYSPYWHLKYNENGAKLGNFSYNRKPLPITLIVLESRRSALGRVACDTTRELVTRRPQSCSRRNESSGVGLTRVVGRGRDSLGDVPFGRGRRLAGGGEAGGGEAGGARAGGRGGAAGLGVGRRVGGAVQEQAAQARGGGGGGGQVVGPAGGAGGVGHVGRHLEAQRGGRGGLGPAQRARQPRQRRRARLRRRRPRRQGRVA